MNRKRLTGLVLIVILAALAIWIDIPQHPSIKIGSYTNSLNVKLGLDLQGGSHLVYRADLSGISDLDATEALGGVRDVIERRVNAFGVSEPVVQTSRVSEEYRIIVELAGVHDPAEAIALIGETPQLDFRREVNGEEAAAQFNIDSADSEITGPIFERTDLTGKQLKRASVAFDSISGAPQVSLVFDKEGEELFAQLTRDNIGSRMAIYLDGVPISAPVVQQEISNGQAVISGGFTVEEARELAQRLNAGALPIPIELIGQQSIGPTLGQQSVQKSVQAGIYGLIAVIIWMIAFYRLPGVVASISLGLYVIFFLAIVKLIPVTLTLAGVAGLILSIGMAVDANVLIFERFRENVRRGKSIPYALESGFAEAWNSIRAANISSLITALILFGFGSSIVRGFAVTFSIGIILSMITAVTLTRSIMQFVLTFKKTHHPALLAAKPTAPK